MADACLWSWGASGDAEVRIVEFEPQHIEEALRLWSEVEGLRLDASDTPEALADFLARNPHLSFVALEGGRVVATVLCGHDGRRGSLYHCAVAPSHQGSGLGRLILARTMAALLDAGIRKCHLLVFRSNAAGVSFWRSVGAQDRTMEVVLFTLPTDRG